MGVKMRRPLASHVSQRAGQTTTTSLQEGHSCSPKSRFCACYSMESASEQLPNVDDYPVALNLQLELVRGTVYVDEDAIAAQKVFENEIVEELANLGLANTNRSESASTSPTTSGGEDSPTTQLEPAEGGTEPVEAAAACHGCLEPGQLTALPCGSDLCPDCVNKMIVTSFKSGSTPIVSGNQVVPTELIRSALSHADFRAYETRLTALKTHMIDRNVGKEHVETVRKLGFQICPRCGRGVERTDGCNEIRCFCTCRFCYACGEQFEQAGTHYCPTIWSRSQPIHVHNWGPHLSTCPRCQNSSFMACSVCHEQQCSTCQRATPATNRCDRNLPTFRR